MQYMRKGLAGTAALVALGLGAAACGSSGGGSTGNDNAGGKGGGLTGSVAIVGSEPQNPLVSLNTNETGGGDVLDAMTTGLVNYNPKDAAPEMADAESIETKDNQNFTVKLKKGLKFSDGTPVTAQSYVDTWNYGAYGPNATLNSYFFTPIEGFADLQGTDANGDGVISEDEATVKTMSGLKVTDDTTFTIKTTEPVSNLPVRLGYTAFVPLPKAFFDDPKGFGEKPVGNGPYKFVSWKHNQAIDMTANTDYNLADKATFKDLTYKIYQNQDAAYNDLLGGNVDIMATLPSSALAGDTYKSDLGDRFAEQATGVFQSFTFPPTKVDPSYDNPKLRQAISEAIDRDSIVKNIFSGARIPADGWVSPVVDGYQKGVCGDVCKFNPDQAKKLFQEAGGYNGTMTLSYNADGDHKAWTEAVCNSISQTLGTPCVATPVTDFATFRTEITNRNLKGMFRSGWQMDYPSIENFLAPLYGTGAGSNDSDYSNPKFDALLKQAAAADTAEKANDLYVQAEKQLVDDLPAVPLWYGKLQAGWDKKIKSVTFNPFGTVALQTVKLAS